MTSLRLSAQNEKQAASFWIWIRLVDSIFFTDNSYAKRVSNSDFVPARFSVNLLLWEWFKPITFF